MAKAAYVGVSGVARKIKKMYVGVSGIARKVKKAYIGVAGVARLFFSGELALTKLASTYIDNKRFSIKSGYARAGNYAILAGGNYYYYSEGAMYESRSALVFAVDDNLTITNPSSLTIGRYSPGAASAGTNAVIAGGNTDDPWAEETSPSSVVNAYSQTLTRSTLSTLSHSKMTPFSITFQGNAVFAGGVTTGYTYYYRDSIDVYNDSTLAKTSPNTLTTGRYGRGVATTPNYLVIMGGSGSTTSVQKKVEAFDANFTKTNLTDLASNLSGSAVGANVRNYALIGANGTLYVTDNNLVRLSNITMPFSGVYIAESHNGAAVFANTNGVATIDANLVVQSYPTQSMTGTAGASGIAIAGNNLIMFSANSSYNCNTYVDSYSVA